MQNFQNVRVPGNDPGVQIDIPVHRIFPAQAMKKRIGIRQNLRVEEMVKAQWRIRAFDPGGYRGTRCHAWHPSTLGSGT